MSVDCKQLISYFREYYHQEKSQKMHDYMRGQYDFIGLQSKERRDLVREYKKAHDYFVIEDLSKDARKIWPLKEREFQYIYLDFLKKKKKKLTKDSIETLEFLITHKSWWDTVDLIATHLVGQVFKKYPELIDEYYENWLNSNNIWLKRTLILFQLKYKAATDERLLFKTINENLGSHEFFINKAIGWALREYSKTNKEAVAKYIEKTNLSKLSKKEGSKYL